MICDKCGKVIEGTSMVCNCDVRLQGYTPSNGTYFSPPSDNNLLTEIRDLLRQVKDLLEYKQQF